MKQTYKILEYELAYKSQADALGSANYTNYTILVHVLLLIVSRRWLSELKFSRGLDDKNNPSRFR